MNTKPPRRHRSTRLIAALVLGTGALAAQAAGFTTVSQTQSVAISGDLLAFDPNTGTQEDASFSDLLQGPTGTMPPGELRLGLDIALPDHPEYSANGQGLSRQSFVAGADGLRFTGSADVNVYGSFSGASAVPEGNGMSNVKLSYEFSVDEATPVQLLMNSSASSLESNDFRFSLSQVGGNAIWNSALDEDEYGLPTRRVDENFLLGPGTYTVMAWLHAESSLRGDLQVAGNTTADFILRPVPEPGTWLMLGAGLGLVGWQARRRRAG